jgi:hypothetical protein
MKTKFRHVILSLLIAAFSAGFLSCETGGTSSADYTIYALAGNKGVFISKNTGRSWKEFNRGLPAGCEPVRIYSAEKAEGSNDIYLATMDSGLFILEGGGWVPLNNEPFRSRRTYKADGLYRKITAFAADRLNPQRILAAAKHAVYESTDKGKTWSLFKTNGIPSLNYITSLAVDGRRAAVGTSFSGIFMSSGGRFEQRNKGLYMEPYIPSRSYTEEITWLSFDKGGLVYAGLNSGGGAYRSSNNGASWERIGLPEMKFRFAAVTGVFSSETGLTISADGFIFRKAEEGAWTSIPLEDEIYKKAPSGVTFSAAAGLSPSNPPVFFYLNRFPSDTINPAADNKRAVYVSLSMLRNRLSYIVKAVKSSGMNSVVIDMKDDAGNIYFAASEPNAKEIGAEKPYPALAQRVSVLKKEGIYLIARMVVFKDLRLYKGYSNKYAIKTAGSGKPWKGVEHEYWVDPHSKFVHDYNIGLAKDAAALGFDEIQFDYIRFPSDGPTGSCRFTFMEDPDTFKSEPITDFLRRAVDELNVPVSVDIYGFNSWYHSGNWIGQDMEEFSRVVDVISPMVYPSHFGSRFYSRMPHAERPYHIIYDGGARAVRLIRNRAVIRPYLQAFNMMSPTYGPAYIRDQVRGAEESGCRGYIFWNAKGEYDPVVRAFSR